MKTILFILAISFCTQVKAQLGNIFFGGSGDDFIYEMVPSPDGNFYLVGSKTIQIPQVWLMKVTPSGELLWEKTYQPDDDAEAEYGYSVNVFPDGSLVLTGEVRSDATFREESGLAIKTNEDGVQVWRKRYEDISTIFDAVPSGNGLLFGGWYDNTGSSDSGIILFTDANGVPGSRIQVDIHNQNYVKKIFPLEDGHFLLVGRSNVIGVGFGGIFLRKIKSNGDVVWTTTNDTEFEELLSSAWDEDYYPPLAAFVDPAGNITVVNPNGYYPDIKVIRFAKDGGLIDEKIYGDGSIHEFPFAVLPLEDKGLLIAGSLRGYSSFALRITEDGLEEWREYFYSTNASLQIYDAEETANRFILGGRYQDDVTGNSDFDGLLLAIEKDGNRYPYTIKGKVVLDENFNCQVDPGEISLPQWFVDVSGQSRYDTLMTDQNGTFNFRTDEGFYQFNLYNRDTSEWNICTNPITIESNASTQIDSLVFLIQPRDLCPKSRVSITQPSLIRCDTACFTASVLNDGIVTSEEQILTIEFDQELSLASASQPYATIGSDFIFEIDPMDRWETRNIDLCVVLDCNVQLGATHTIKASVADACIPVYEGPRYAVKGDCDGDAIRFRMYNSGGGGVSANTLYSVFADGLIVEENIPITLPEGGAETILTFPADGRTWRIKVEQEHEAPGHDHPTDVIEGCGKQNTGLHSVAFKNAFHSNDFTPATCIVQVENTLTVSNKVQESTTGLGYYNFLTEIRPLEYTARVRNQDDHSVSEISIDLALSPSLDPRSFRLFFAPGNTTVSYPQHNTIRVTSTDLDLLSGQDFMIRFALQPRAGTLPDAGGQSLFVVEANAYLDKEGPTDLFAAFNNYSLSAPVHIDQYNTYPEEIKLYGGRNYDFGICMAKGMDGSLFVAGESNSYNTRFKWDGFVVKTNKHGEAHWLMSVDDGRNGFNSVRGISALPDGGCLTAGVSIPEGLDHTVSNTRIHMARLDTDGNILWNKIINPTTPAWTKGMMQTADNNFIIYGVTRNTGGDQFYVKVDANGEVVWSNFQNINGSYFDPSHGIALSDGSCVFVGTNNSTIIDVDVFVEKISPSGQIIWNTEYQSQDYIDLGGIGEGLNGELMIAGESFWVMNDTNYVITPTFIKLDPEGNVVWERSPVIGPFNIARVNCIIPAEDGGYLAGGEILADTSGQLNDMLLMKINAEAEVLWYGNYGAKNDEWASVMTSFSEDEIFLWGHNQSRPPYYNLQGVLVKTNGFGELVSIFPNEDAPPTFERTFIFPNPANDAVSVILSPRPVETIAWIITDMVGRIILNGNAEPDEFFAVETSTLHAGSYILAFPASSYPSKQIIIAR